MLVVNSMKVAITLLEKNGAVFLDRPHLVVGCELIEYNRLLVVDSRINVEQRWAEIIEKEALRLVKNLAGKPEDFLRRIRL